MVRPPVWVQLGGANFHLRKGERGNPLLGANGAFELTALEQMLEV